MSSRKNPRIHFVVPYSFNLAPGQRFRFEQYFEFLQANGFTLKFSPFLRDSDYPILYTKGNVFRKIMALAIGFAKRIFLLPLLGKADYVFIFREAAPIGPPFFEWIITRVLQKKVIYDFDDAIWLTDKPRESWLSRVLRWRKR